MSQITNSKHYDLEDRCLAFAHKVNHYVNALPRSIPNIENARQLVRSAGSMGANYIEANESLSKKDFLLRIKISKKETKETRYWLNLTSPYERQNNDRILLIQESNELMKIFGAIIEKSK